MALFSGNLYLAVLLLSAAVCGFMGYLATRHRFRRGAKAFSILVFCLFAWALTEAAVLVATTKATALLANQIQFIAVPFVPVALVAMALRYTGHEAYISRTTLNLLLVVPSMTVLLVLTNAYHSFFWASTSLVPVDPFSVLATEPGPWYNVHLLYSYLLLLVGTATLARWALNAEPTYKRQANYILIGIAVPWIANIAKQLALSDSPLDPTPVFFSVTGVFIGVAILRFQFLDLAPVARNTVVEVMREGLLVVDSEGRIVDANPAARGIIDEENPVGMDLSEVAPPALVDACLGHTGDETLTLPTAAGERTFDLRQSNLPGDARVVLLYDVTERRRQAEQLERQNDRLERFGSVLSHDLRNPLNVTQGYVGLLADEAEGEEAEHARRSLDGLDRMEQLIDDTLELTREGPAVTEPESVDLASVARSAWRGVETGEATLETETEMTVQGDEERLRRLFENLFRNSVEHSSTNSRREVDGAFEHGSTGNRTETGDAVEHGTSPEELVIHVESLRDGFAVADNGPGIPEKKRESVLEFGFTTSEDGTGLGLSIVTEIAEAHGWRVEVTESEAGGTRIEFRGIEGAGGRETP